MLDTQTIPPKPPSDKAVAGGIADNNELGDQIAALTPEQGRALRDYLIIVYGNPLAPKPGGEMTFRKGKR